LSRKNLSLKENQRINPMQSKLPRQRVSHRRLRCACLPNRAFGTLHDPLTRCLPAAPRKKELGGACALMIDKGAVNTRE
jgi:hypothetical protein